MLVYPLVVSLIIIRFVLILFFFLLWLSGTINLYYVYYPISTENNCLQ